MRHTTKSCNNYGFIHMPKLVNPFLLSSFRRYGVLAYPPNAACYLSRPLYGCRARLGRVEHRSNYEFGVCVRSFMKFGKIESGLGRDL